MKWRRSLNSRSGLKGVCGISDMREILDQAGKGDERARLAVRDVLLSDQEIYRRLHRGPWPAGCRSLHRGHRREFEPPCAASICEGLEHMGIIVDEGRNAAVSGNITEIQKDKAPIKILVVKTDEEREIARQTVRSIENALEQTRTIYE